MFNFRSSGSQRRSLRFERLEERRVLASVVVSINTDTVDWNFNAVSTDFVQDLINNPGADNRISLREAIIATNRDPNTSGPDEITFDPTIFLATGMHTIQLGNTQGQIDINDALSITGPSSDPNVLTIIADANSRIFNISDGSALTDSPVAISGLTLTGGNLNTASGGAVFSADSLALSSVSVEGNSSTQFGGGVHVEPSSNRAALHKPALGQRVLVELAA